MKSECLLRRRAILLMLATLLFCKGLFYMLSMPSGSLWTYNNTIIGEEEQEEGGGGGAWRPEHKTVVLIWEWPFGNRVKLGSCYKLFNITGCRFTDNKREYGKVDGVMFHHRDILTNLRELLWMRRPPLQKWVWMNMESPGNSQRQARLDGLFNLTATYRRDSDIWVPYGRIIEAAEKNQTFHVPLKDKLVCWIVNHWNRRMKRVRYFYELKKHIPIHTYGGAFRRKLSLEEYSETLKSCKFYLSFENSIYTDYITEKLFNPMKVGTVPVVLGPPRNNYEEFIPADSFIHVDDFKSPQELAERLKYLDQNQEMYERYFTWRQHFTAEASPFTLEHVCRICDHIKRYKNNSVVQNLSKWYWG